MTTTARLGSTTNLIHGFIYFADEATEAYRSVGLDDGAHYFGSRAAPLGAVPAEVVVATFFNFCPRLVATAIPAAWDQVAPAALQTARLSAAGRVLHRDDIAAALEPAAVERGIEIAQAMCDGVGFEGKPLAAANKAAPLPDDPATRLWQLISIVREWRGDAHISALDAAGVTGIESLVLHAATGAVPVAALRATRGWTDDEWQAAVVALAQRNLVHPDASFTAEGEAFRADIEATTNRRCDRLVDAVGEDATVELLTLLRPGRDALLNAGIFPAALRR